MLDDKSDRIVVVAAFVALATLLLIESAGIAGAYADSAGFRKTSTSMMTLQFRQSR